MKYLFLFFISLLSLSQAANLVRLAQAPADTIGFWRLLLSCLILLPALIQRGSFKEMKLLPRVELAWALASGVFFFIHLFTFFLAAQNTKIANCMIIFSLNPLFTALGAWIFFKEKPKWTLGVAYVLAFLGLWTLFSRSLELKPEKFSGDLLALLSGILFSAYILTGRRVRQKMTNFAYIFLIFALAGVFFGTSAILRGSQLWNFPSITWLAILGLVVFPTLLGHSLFNYALKFININLMSCGKLIEPIFSAAMAALIFAEPISQDMILAFTFTGTGVLLLFIPPLLNKSLANI